MQILVSFLRFLCTDLAISIEYMALRLKSAFISIIFIFNIHSSSLTEVVQEFMKNMSTRLKTSVETNAGIYILPNVLSLIFSNVQKCRRTNTVILLLLFSCCHFITVILLLLFSLA